MFASPFDIGFDDALFVTTVSFLPFTARTDHVLISHSAILAIACYV